MRGRASKQRVANNGKEAFVSLAVWRIPSSSSKEPGGAMVRRLAVDRA